MTANALLTRSTAQRWALALSAVGLLALAGCKTDKEAKGLAGGGKKSDPLVYGPTRIPKQDLPLPDRGIGTKGKTDPLTTPTGGRNDKAAGYTDDPERFKGTVLPGKTTTPASLAGRIKDGDELKIEAPGVPLQLAGGVPGVGAPDAAEGVSALSDRLEKLGVKREDRTVAFEGGKYVCRASVVISSEGARRQYTGEGATAVEAVKQVVDQVAADRK